MPPRDVYDRATLTSIDILSEEMLFDLADTYEKDPELEAKKIAMEFTMRFLTGKELELLFFRFIHGNSYKTLKKTMKYGATKTAASYIRRLKRDIKEYINYSVHNNYDNDIAMIKEELGSDAMIIAERMFLRESKNKIKTSKIIPISQNRLARTILDIEILCLSKLQLQGFWQVIKKIGRLPVKKS